MLLHAEIIQDIQRTIVQFMLRIPIGESKIMNELVRRSPNLRRKKKVENKDKREILSRLLILYVILQYPSI